MRSVRWVMTGAIVAGLATNSGLAAENTVPPDYVKQVMLSVIGKMEYPRLAKMRHEEGIVAVSVAIAPTGGVSEVNIVKSSGLQSLDDAALAAVQAAAPFPPPPAAGTVVRGALRFTAD